MNENEFRTALVVPQFKEGFKLESIPVNLSYLGAVLSENGFLVRGYNLNLEDCLPEEFADFDLIGVTVVTATFAKALKFLEKVRAVNSHVFTVLGGPHPTARPEDCLVPGLVDAVMICESEHPLLKLVQTLSSGSGDLESVPNLVYRHGSNIIRNALNPIVPDLDSLPFPNKDIFDPACYESKQKAFGDIIASRGCPFRCTNCKPGLDRIAPYRLRRPERVVDEIEFLMKRYGIRHFTFSDSELVGPRGWVLKFCDEIIRRGVRITFSCNGRTDQANEEVLKALKKAGCIFIGYGAESGSQRVLDDVLKKGINLERTREIVNMTTSLGIGVGTWFMIGIPGETWEDVLKTIDYSRTLNASIIEVNIATPWPDTGFYDVCKLNGWSISEDWASYNEKSYAAIETPYLSRAQVSQAFDLFREGLLVRGWKSDVTQTRFFHPHFILRTVSSGISSVLRRGVQREDFVKMSNWLRNKF